MNDSSLRKLSTREKTQLAELTKTREKIVHELSKFPSSQINVSDEFSRFHNQRPPTKDNTQSIYQILSKTNQLNHQSTGSGRNSRSGLSSSAQRLQFSRSSEYTEHLRSSLDMIPILASSGEVAMEVDMHNKKGKMKLPIFKLPAIEPRLLTQEKKRRALDETMGSSTTTNSVQTFVSYSDRKTFRRAISLILRSLSPRDLAFIQQYLGVTDADVGSITAELEKIDGKKVATAELDVLPNGTDRKRSLRAVFVLAEFFSRDPAVPISTTFMRAKEFMHQQRFFAGSRSDGESSQSALRAFAGGGGLSEGSLSVLGLSAAFQQFIGLSAPPDDSHRGRTASTETPGTLTLRGDAEGGFPRKIHSLPEMRGSMARTPQDGNAPRRSRTAADTTGNYAIPLDTSAQFPPMRTHGFELSSRGAMRISTLDFQSSTGASSRPHPKSRVAGGGALKPPRHRDHATTSGAEGTAALTRALIESLRVMDKHSKMVNRHRDVGLYFSHPFIFRSREELRTRRSLSASRMSPRRAPSSLQWRRSACSPHCIASYCWNYGAASLHGCRWYSRPGARRVWD